MAKSFVKGTYVKDYVKGRTDGMRVSAEVMEALDKRVEQLIDAAIPNAVKDKRNTLKARDFEV